jgi:hypothetical protein
MTDRIDTLSFDSWMTQVNVILDRELGLEASDLEDFDWNTEYTGGASPEAAVVSFFMSIGFTSAGSEFDELV